VEKRKKNLRFTIMKKLLFIGFIVAMITILGTSCSKGGTPTDDGTDIIHNPAPNDTIAPVLDIYTPTAAQVFTNGSVISVTGKITDDLGLYRGTIKIINDANGTILKEQPYEIHGIKTYNFSISHTAGVTIVSDYTVTVSFEDHGYNTVTKSVKVKVNP
jgi:hypothetical protein